MGIVERVKMRSDESRGVGFDEVCLLRIIEQAFFMHSMHLFDDRV